MIFLYTGAAFELPSRSPSFKEAAQISTLHGALFAGVALVTMATAHMLSPRTAPFPFTPVLAALPIAVVVLANAIIVPVLGTESWLDDETSVLLVIQMLAVAESAAAAATLLILWWRHCRGDRRRMAREAATAAAASTQSGAFGVRRAAGVPGGLPGAALAADEAGGDEDGADALSVDQIPAYLLAADREETSALLGLLGVGGPAAAAAAKGAGAGGPSFMSPRSVAAVPGASPRLGYYPSSSTAAADAVAQQLNFSMASASAAGGGGVNGSMMMMPSDGGAAGGTPDAGGAGAGGAGEDGGIDSLPLTVPPGLVVQRLLYLQRREADLTARLDAVTRELVAAAAGTGQTELPSLLRATQEELRALQDAHRDLQTRHAELELRAHVLEGELGIAQTKMGAVKKELRKEQGNNRKLLQNIEALRVAGMRSEAAIDDLQQRLSATAAAAAASAAAASASASASGAGGGGVSVSSGNMRAALRGDGSAAGTAGGAPAGSGSAGAAGSGGGAGSSSVSSSGMGIALGMGMGGGTGNAALNASSLTRPSFMMHAAAGGMDGGGRAGSAGGSVGGHGGPRSYAPAPVGSYNSGGGGPLSAGSAVGSYGSSMAGSLRSSSRLVSQHSVGTIPPGALSHAASIAPLPLLPPAAPAPSGRSDSPAVAVPVSEAQPHDRSGKGGRGSSADGAFPDDI